MPASAAAEKEQPATRFAKDQLKAFVERIERLEEEKKATSDDIRDVYAEAKGTGFDTKIMRQVIRMRFGLEDGQDRTLSEIADELGVSRERIRQIESEALHKLRRPGLRQKLREYIE